MKYKITFINPSERTTGHIVVSHSDTLINTIRDIEKSNNILISVVIEQ